MKLTKSILLLYGLMGLADGPLADNVPSVNELLNTRDTYAEQDSSLIKNDPEQYIPKKFHDVFEESAYKNTFHFNTRLPANFLSDATVDFNGSAEQVTTISKVYLPDDENSQYDITHKSGYDSISISNDLGNLIGKIKVEKNTCQNPNRQILIAYGEVTLDLNALFSVSGKGVTIAYIDQKQGYSDVTVDTYLLPGSGENYLDMLVSVLNDTDIIDGLVNSNIQESGNQIITQINSVAEKLYSSDAIKMAEDALKHGKISQAEFNSLVNLIKMHLK